MDTEDKIGFSFGILLNIAGILAAVIHLWTIGIVFSKCGLFGAVLAAIFPIISEFCWFFRVGNDAGFGDAYCVTIMICAGLYATPLVAQSVAERFVADSGD